MNELKFEGQKVEVFQQVAAYIDSLRITVDSVDSNRPWGGFFVIKEADTSQFIDKFFPECDLTQLKKFGEKLSPKILVVEPGEQLSWQYHHRRAELWKIIQGPVGIIASSSDTQSQLIELNSGQSRQFKPRERHRLVGLAVWGIVAEIWQHTDPSHPSDEDDIVRLSDNYGRGS